jgi:hypothetical protein
MLSFIILKVILPPFQHTPQKSSIHSKMFPIPQCSQMTPFSSQIVRENIFFGKIPVLTTVLSFSKMIEINTVSKMLMSPAW